MKLTLVGLPLGNHLDISLRALRALNQTDLVICEDTRVFHKLYSKLLHEGYLSHPFIGKLKVINEFHEKDRLPQILEDLKQAIYPILVSDAGMPAFSDPGFHLVNSVIESGGEIDTIPGSTAATTALALSGFSSDRVLFLGFLPKKTAKRNKLWQDIKNLETGLTITIYEAPQRVVKTLEEIHSKLGVLPCVVASELTKNHQTLHRGSLSDLILKLSKTRLRGEYVILIRTQ